MHHMENKENFLNATIAYTITITLLSVSFLVVLSIAMPCNAGAILSKCIYLILCVWIWLVTCRPEIRLLFVFPHKDSLGFVDSLFFFLHIFILYTFLLKSVVLQFSVCIFAHHLRTDLSLSLSLEMQHKPQHSY